MGYRLAEAIAFAAEKHKDVLDKGGMPYILHPLKVCHYLKTDDVELMCIAVLHDVVEDCYADPDDGFIALRELGMTERVIDGVRALTKLKDQTPDHYLAGIIKNIDAVKVKLCDLRHNMDIRRLKGVSEKDLKRIDKYCKMYLALKDLV